MSGDDAGWKRLENGETMCEGSEARGSGSLFVFQRRNGFAFWLCDSASDNRKPSVRETVVKFSLSNDRNAVPAPDIGAEKGSANPSLLIFVPDTLVPAPGSFPLLGLSEGRSKKRPDTADPLPAEKLDQSDGSEPV